MRYFLHDNGSWMSMVGDPDRFGMGIPAGFREVTEEEYNAAAGVIVVELP